MSTSTDPSGVLRADLTEGMAVAEGMSISGVTETTGRYFTSAIIVTSLQEMARVAVRIIVPVPMEKISTSMSHSGPPATMLTPETISPR